jgi:hypothetical protein
MRQPYAMGGEEEDGARTRTARLNPSVAFNTRFNDGACSFFN